MPRQRPTFVVHGRNYRPTKVQIYLDEFAGYVTISRKSYQVGRSFSSHKDIVVGRSLGRLMSSLQSICQTKIIIELGRFYEEYSAQYKACYNLFTFLRYLDEKRSRIKVLHRDKAFEFIGRPDSGESQSWVNRAVSGKMSSDARHGAHKIKMAAMRWHRNKSVAHKMAYNKRKAPKLRWNDILLLIRTASEYVRILDSIYQRRQYNLPDPEDPSSETFRDMSRLITGNDTLNLGDVEMTTR